MRNYLIQISVIMFPFLVCVNCQTFDESPEVQAFNEDFWGEAGGLSYEQAAQKMQSNHPEWQPLEPRDKKALAFVFGDLTEKVRIHWNAQPLNEWASDQYGIDLIGEDAEAQTYGYDIYMKGPRSAWKDDHRLETLIHELTHSFQFQAYNESLSDYGNIYFREYYIAGQDYFTNRMEVEARNKVNVWLSAVKNEFTKQSQTSPPSSP